MATWSGYLECPLAPPWRVLQDGRGYYNEITGTTSEKHPFDRFVVGTSGGTAGPSAPPIAPEDPDDDGLGSAGLGPGRPFIGPEGSAEVQEGGGSDERQLQLTTMDKSQSLNKKLKHWDFRCMWKELGLFGNVNSYGLTIRYYEDGQTVVNFDGLDGRWHFSQLDGPHGPIDRYDLFVGAKIRVFGRHLTIAATSASTCQWIDDEGKRLMKKQEWLQSKIESVGSVPVVRRPTPTGVKNTFGKKANSGNADLRRISNENKKLAAQMATLGLARLALLEPL